jgi:hypothetical protein
MRPAWILPSRRKSETPLTGIMNSGEWDLNLYRKALIFRPKDEDLLKLIT